MSPKTTNTKQKQSLKNKLEPFTYSFCIFSGKISMQMSYPNSVSALFDQGLQMFKDFCATMNLLTALTIRYDVIFEMCVFKRPTKNCPRQVNQFSLIGISNQSYKCVGRFYFYIGNLHQQKRTC